MGRIISNLIFAENFHSDNFGSLLDGLRQHEQKRLFEAVIHNLQARFFSPLQERTVSPNDDKLLNAIGCVSATVVAIINGRQSLKEQLQDWLVSGVGGGISSISMRRALLITLGKDSGAFSFNLGPGLRMLNQVLLPQLSRFCKEESTCSETSSSYFILQSGLKKVLYPLTEASD